MCWAEIHFVRLVKITLDDDHPLVPPITVGRCQLHQSHWPMQPHFHYDEEGERSYEWG